METEHLHRLIDEKKWTLILRELDLLISKRDSSFDDILISTFEKMDREYRELHAKKHYFEMWKIAYRAGKIKLAKNYAGFILEHLIELKRVPAIKQLESELAAYGLLKTYKNTNATEYILGRKTVETIEEAESFEFHPVMWKQSKAALKNYLLMQEQWDLSHWKLAYEFILKFYYDKEIMLLLAEKSAQLKKDKHHKKILSYLVERGVSIKRFNSAVEKTKPKKEETSKLHTDYDQLAMDVMSGVLEPSLTEQKKILVTVATLTEEELLEKGKDMIVAFGLLGMDKVVVSLSERVVPLITEVKERISIQFMMAQSLFNNGEFYKVCDMVDDIIGSEPLLADEMLAFSYMKAESLLKLKKLKAAKDIFVSIKKHNPHYRLVGERLRALEEIK